MANVGEAAGNAVAPCVFGSLSWVRGSESTQCGFNSSGAAEFGSIGFCQSRQTTRARPLALIFSAREKRALRCRLKEVRRFVG
jgi:hypothetical protein